MVVVVSRFVASTQLVAAIATKLKGLDLELLGNPLPLVELKLLAF
jgi:hypothetical protein